MNERIKKIRQNYKMNQEDFGEKLGVTKTAISKMELGTYNVTDTMIKLLCREFNVDYIWLTTGNGNMFSEKENEDYMSLIDRQMAGESDTARNIFKMFAQFETKDWLALDHMIEIYLNVSKKEPD